jgi:hypothetical protein
LKEGIFKGIYSEAIIFRILKGIDNKQKLEKIEEEFKEVNPSQSECRGIGKAL